MIAIVIVMGDWDSGAARLVTWRRGRCRCRMWRWVMLMWLVGGSGEGAGFGGVLVFWGWLMMMMLLMVLLLGWMMTFFLFVCWKLFAMFVVDPDGN